MNFKRFTSKVDIEKFIDSWEKTFKRKLDVRVYSWIFSQSNNIYCCLDGDHIAAGYCLLDIQAIVGNKIFRGGLCNNVFVNGFKYQKLNVFNQLAEYALNDISDSGYDFALGFPNEKAIKAHMRSGWSQEVDLPLYELKNLSDISVDDSKYQLQWFTGIQSELYNNISRLMRRQYNKYTFSLLKDPDFLEWRFDQNPRYDYDVCCIYSNNIIKGFFISKYFKERARVHLVDYFFNDPKALHVSLYQIYSKYNIERNLSIKCVDAWCSGGDQDIFETAGFSKSDDFSSVIFKDLRGVGMHIGKFSHLTFADNDVY